MVFLFLYVDQVVRVIVIQKTLIEHAEKLREVKAVLEERTFWNGAENKFLRDIQEGSTEAAEVGW
uniref:Uncharacterized protein n=1 Tax=Brassica oleracea TaxID=3712 RepID=A0A3P6DQ42_BRAOL|nr:unnamed protein product [Brassica oleracea]